MVSLSTGLQNAMIDGDGLIDAMSGGVVVVFSGQRPASADAAITIDSTTKVLGYIYETQGNLPAGISLALGPGAVILPIRALRMTCTAGGQPAWFRWTADQAAYLGESALLPRIDGDVGSELFLPASLVASGQKLDVETFIVGF